MTAITPEQADTPQERHCVNCGRPADLTLPRGFISGSNGFCWNCASSPNVLAEPVRPPWVDESEWADYRRYRIEVAADPLDTRFALTEAPD